MRMIRIARTGVSLGLPGILIASALLVGGSANAEPHDLGVVESEEANFRIEVIAEGLEIPWGIDFLPDGRALITERTNGRMSILDVETGALTPIENMPETHFENGSAGLLDVIVHPDFSDNNLIYFSYGVRAHDRTTAVVSRARLVGNRLLDLELIFSAWPRFKYVAHLGLRLALQDGYLFISVGDRYVRDLAQVLNTHNGKIIRLYEDGRVPDDNPFVGREGALPEIWSYGHRNPQGITIHPDSGELWESEHGPQGGDEVNIIRPGLNYGWPIITYGEEYGGGPVGDGLTEKSGMEQPLYYYVPSIAPSGLDFYTGDAFPGWRNNLFTGAMALTHLNRLVIENGKVVHEERLLDDKGWRVRFVKSGPDGFLYIGIDDGMILRLRPETVE